MKNNSHDQLLDEGFEYDCNLKCKCKKPDFNDSIINHETKEPCIHCDICGGVPSHE